MTLQRAQIEVLLEDLEATAWRRHRADPVDPALSRDIVEQARALLRVATLDQHLYICDTAQHLLLRLVDDGIQRVVQPTRDRIPDLGIPLVTDPFDLDAYVPREPAEIPASVRVLPGPQAMPMFVPDEPRQLPDAAPVAERRADCEDAGESELRRGLTTQQLHTLDTMSHFGWTLRFVRRPLFQPPVPVAFDRNRERFVVVESDGSIDDARGLPIRD